MSEQRMMHIGELAERVGLSLRSLRHWDEIGLVSASGRTDGGFRLYTDADEVKVRFVMLMKPLGFSLDEIAELIAARDADPEHPLAALTPERRAHYAAAASERHRKLTRDLAATESFLALTSEY
jgi:MerR family transcriptional regulator, copper efflux regulator